MSSVPRIGAAVAPTNIGGVRQKSFSESSSDSSASGDVLIHSPNSSDARFLCEQQQDKKQELYDFDGKHKYKFFNQVKPKTATGRNEQQQQQNVLYDLDGKYGYTVYNPALHQSLFSAAAQKPK